MILYDKGILDMSDARAAQDRGDVLVIDRAPIVAIQALYHAATGKTENLKKGFTKNFVVRKNDLEQSHYRILQQLDHFERVAGPTVTVKVSFHNEKSQQFSSWERFKLFDSSKDGIVSEVVIKYEFLIRLPELKDPQRYILNIDVDSKLPVVNDDG